MCPPNQGKTNVYLHELDLFIKHDLRCSAYLRYCDDFVMFGNDKQELHGIKENIAEFLEKLRLRLHPKKTLIALVAVGTDFLGFRVYPTHTRIRKENVKRFVRRMKKHQWHLQ